MAIPVDLSKSTRSKVPHQVLCGAWDAERIGKEEKMATQVDLSECAFSASNFLGGYAQKKSYRNSVQETKDTKSRKIRQHI